MSHVIPLVVVWGIVVTRVSMLRRPGTPRVLWITLALLAGASTLRLKSVYEATNQLTGSIVGGSVLKVSLAVAACAGLRTMIATLPGGAGTRLARREWATAAVVIAVVSVPILVWPPQQVSPQAVKYAEFYDTTWRSWLHWGPYLVYLAWAMAGGLSLFGRYGTTAPYRRLATGLRFVAAGCALGFVYIALKSAALVAWHVDAASASTWMKLAEGSLGALVLAMCIVLIGVGSAWEAVIGRLSESPDGLWGRWALWRLAPLWSALVAGNPAIVFDAGAERSVRRVGFRLVRRATEIRDGIWELEQQVDPDLVDQARAQVEAAGYVGDDASAMVLAVMVRWAALGPGGQGRAELAGDAGHDLASEVRWLAMVARDYQRAPLAKDLARELRVAMA
jgi:hypothetical protein